MTTCARIALCLSLVAPAFAGERRVQESDVPRPVLDGIAKKYPSAKKLGFSKEVEHGKTVYEARLDADGKKLEVELAPDGKILVEEETIAFADTPDAVKKGLAASAKFGKWTVKRAEKVTAGDGATPAKYEIVVASGKKSAEVTFSADGKLLGSERSEDDDDDDR